MGDPATGPKDLGTNSETSPTINDHVQARLERLERQVRRLTVADSAYLVILFGGIGFFGVLMLDSKQRGSQVTPTPRILDKPADHHPELPIETISEGHERNREIPPIEGDLPKVASKAEIPVQSQNPDVSTARGSLVYEGEDFSLTLSDLRVGRLKSTVDTPLLGPLVANDERLILMNVSVRNRSERKVIHYQPLTEFGGVVLTIYSITDDVDNILSPLDPRTRGAGAKGQVHIHIVGHVPLPADLQPGDRVNDIYCCELPLPKTQFLKLRIGSRVACFSGDGPCAEADFKANIPLSWIKDYPSR